MTVRERALFDKNVHLAEYMVDRLWKHDVIRRLHGTLKDAFQVGYIALEDNLYAAIGKRFAAGTTGTLFPKGAEVGATLDRYLK